MITPLPTSVIAPTTTNKPTSQLHMLTKTRPTPSPTIIKAYQDLPITILSHSIRVFCQLPHPITPTMLVKPLGLSGTRTWMRGELRAFVFCVMKNLYLDTSVRTKGFTHCVLLKRMGRVVREKG